MWGNGAEGENKDHPDTSGEENAPLGGATTREIYGAAAN
jgi:hypothetical protein